MINKWKANISKYCNTCEALETTYHMFYDCSRVGQEWKTISNCNIDWKTIICGFQEYATCNKVFSINFVIAVIPYVIFKGNSYCKFNDKRNAKLNLKI